jgi:hypothetical protein
MIGSSNRSTTNAYSSKFVGICTLLLATITCQISVAQDWPVNSPEAYEPVPQYEPQRYPLANQPVTTQGPAASPSQSPVSLPASQSQTNQLIQSENVLPANEPVKVASPQKSKSAAHQPNGNQVNWEIYRDRNPHPIDPRKPCNNCTHPHGTQPRCNCNLPGVNGRSYIEREPGGCQCDQKNPSKHPEFSVHWPRPFSAKLADHGPHCRCGCQKKKLVDVFDGLSTFKISKYKRTDNGYCGPGSDPYGCLGESKQASRVAGVGYRFPSEPVPRGPVSIFND